MTEPNREMPRSEAANGNLEERAIWLDEEGRRFVVERIQRAVASVSSEDRTIGRVPLPASLPSLSRASRAQLRAIVQAALRRRDITQWEGEGGSVPEVDTPTTE